ncbi:MAG TPA: DCC1-like thiol-disulfide oxidoreductase family protein [Verrucomicrobiae bacterium]
MNAPMMFGNRRFGRRRTSRNVEMFAAIGMGDEIQTPPEWLMFDRACPFCTRVAKRIEPTLAKRGVKVIPLQTDWAREFLAARDEPLLKEIRFLSAGGKLTGGADALVEVARRIWWTRAAVWMTKFPGVMWLLRRGYAAVAARRHCLVTRRAEKGRVGRALLTYAPSVLLTGAAMALRGALPGWIYMWTVAGALFFAAKWITVAKLLSKGAHPGTERLLAYCFLWPGLDAQAFCLEREVAPAAARETGTAISKMAVGAALIWIAGGLTESVSFVAGWLAMIGVVLFLHFGIFALLAQFWRRRGVNARPLMLAPAKTTSISKLWSGRWNTAFTDLMHKEVFAPIAKRRGAAAGIMGVFLISGLLHELVISLPARGGYGSPTAYFVLQGAAVLIERSHLGAKLGLGRGLVGWLFVVMFAAVPAFMLFPPVFVHNVILPMLEFLKPI